MVIASIPLLQLFFFLQLHIAFGRDDIMGSWILDLCAKGHTPSDSPKAILSAKYLPASHMVFSPNARWYYQHMASIGKLVAIFSGSIYISLDLCNEVIWMMGKNTRSVKECHSAVTTQRVNNLGYIQR